MFTKALLPDTFRAIQLVSKFTEIKYAYLAGGTALALQLGHRISVDLDFFTLEQFDAKELSIKLGKYKEFTPAGVTDFTVWGTIGKTKFSIFYYKYPLLNKTLEFEGLRIASLADIAGMKINAIESRGTRRDFIDLFFLSDTFTLAEMLEFYQKKYSVLDDHFYYIHRALDYFEDAEKESVMPKMLIKVDWEKVKEFFRKETRRLAEKKLQI